MYMFRVYTIFNFWCVCLCVFQHWEVFKVITEVFILVPALVGLKGNLEMTLAARLSTAVCQPSWQLGNLLQALCVLEDKLYSEIYHHTHNLSCAQRKVTLNCLNLLISCDASWIWIFIFNHSSFWQSFWQSVKKPVAFDWRHWHIPL